jgi:hypothetical protein
LFLDGFCRVCPRVAVQTDQIDERGLGRLQSKAELPQPTAQGILHAQSIGSILETDHKVIDVAHQMGFAPQPAAAEGDNRSYRTSLLLMETPSGAPDCEAVQSG